MEMEETFLRLREEVARLRDLCAEQGKLLRKLTARKGPVLDIPVSLPIQCTEDTVTEDTVTEEGHSHQTRSEAPASAASDPQGSAHPLAQPQAADTPPGLDGEDPPSAVSGRVLGGGAGGAALAAAAGSNTAERNEEAAAATWLETCRMFPAVGSPRGEVRACRSPRESATPNPAPGGSLRTLPDLSEAPGALSREDAPGTSALPAGAQGPVQIRGPAKTRWTPGWMLEDAALGAGAGLASEDAEPWGVCQELFPSGYGEHVWAHMK